MVELLMGIVVVGILVALAVPNFQTWLRNTEVRNAAESISIGLQRARAESVARNAYVRFVLGTGSSWTVDLVTKPVPTDPPIDSHASTEGSTNVSLNAVAADLATPATTVTFNSLGEIGGMPATRLNADGTEPFARVDVTAPGSTRSLRVTLGFGGNVRMCEPDLAAGSSPRAC